MKAQMNARYFLESLFTILLWSLWMWSAYLVGKDIVNGVFLEYAEPKFWLFVACAAVLVSATFLILVKKRRPYKQAIKFHSLNSNYALEEKVLTEFFSVPSEALLLARNAKNLHVDFPGDDHKCQVRFALNPRLPSGHLDGDNEEAVDAKIAVEKVIHA